MKPATLNLDVYRGDGFAKVISFVVGASAMAVDDWTFAAQIREYADSEDTMAEFEIDMTNAADGEILLVLTGATTAEFERSGVWDLEGTVSGGEPQTLLAGEMRLSRDATR